jgi:hypothetical protein
MACVQRDIAEIKETLAEMASEAREDRQYLTNAFEEIDIGGREMTYEAKEERDNINYMLLELLSEIQQRN